MVTETGSGNAGTITVRNANSVEVDGAKIATETYGSGDAGLGDGFRWAGYP